MSAPQRARSLTVGLIGTGRVGSVLAAALAAAGHRIVAATGGSPDSLDRAARLLPGVPLLPADEVAARADLVLVAVPDDVLGQLVAGLAELGAWRPGQLVVHTSGAHGAGGARARRPGRRPHGRHAPGDDVHRRRGRPRPAGRHQLRGDHRAPGRRPRAGRRARRRAGRDRRGGPPALPRRARASAPTTWSPSSTRRPTCWPGPAWPSRAGCSRRCCTPRWTTRCAPATPR